MGVIYMDVFTDRTTELEQQFEVIFVDSRDGCSFFKVRAGSAVTIRQCWYCNYGLFDRENPDIRQKGLCKFKRP